MTASLDEKRKSLLAILLLALPIVLFYGILWHERTGIPIVDDYSALLHYALNWTHLPDWKTRCISIVSWQDTEYKLIVDHVAVASNLALTGRVDLLLLTALGNGMLLPICWVWGRNTAVEDSVLSRRLFLFVPVAFLLFQLNYAETVNWAMAGLQNLTVIAASLWTFDLLLRDTRAAAVGANCTALVACCASANGFLLFPIGLWHLLRRKRIGSAVLWCAVFLLTGSAYVYRMQWVQRPKPGFEQFWYFFLNLLGGGFENMHRQPLHGLATFIGLLMVLGVAVRTSLGAMRRDRFAALAMVWTMLTCLMIGWGRAGMGAAFAFSGRYKIYSDLMLVALYCSGIDLVRNWQIPPGRKRVLYGAVLTCSIVMCLLSDVLGQKFLHDRREDLQTAFQEWSRSGGTMPPMHDPQVAKHEGLSDTERRARAVLELSVRAGLYRIPGR